MASVNKRYPWFLVMAFIIPVLMGMSGLGGNQAKTVEMGVYDAKILDTSNTTVKISWVNMDGKLMFKGFLGKGRIQIPFNNISYIDISKDEACIHLKDNKKLCGLKVNALSRIYGKTDYGNYQIALKDIKRIELIKTR